MHDVSSVVVVCNACIGAKPYVVGGSEMVLLDRAVTSSHWLSILIMSICSSLAAVLNAELLPANIHPRAPNYRIVSWR